MKRYQLYNKRKDFFENNHKYCCIFWKDFDFSIFDKIMYVRRSGQGHDESFDDVIIMCDTETSKERKGEVCKNYVVAWTISIRAFDCNICTLYGSKPSEFVECIEEMRKHFQGDKTVLYWHNMSYDYTFLRKFMFRKWGTPDQQLNVKSHYPLFINFNNGIIMKDSLILAQRKLEKWAEDLDVEHKKAVGCWDYDKIRNQSDIASITADELKYIENDTLAGVECIQKTMDILHKRIYSIPYTATGIPRERVREIGKENHARDLFKSIVPEFYIQEILEAVYHGGYTHANRHYISRTQTGIIICLDFNSSYPYCLLSEKYPMERFKPLNKVCDVEYIIRNSEHYAFIFKLIMLNPRLKSDDITMPVLQMSKSKTINAIEDNGKVLKASYSETYLNETDLKLIYEQYDADKFVCMDVHFAMKDYLPRWFTDYVFKCYTDKCELKGGDPVAYSLAKAIVNSLYGMLCQKPCKEMIDEDYQTGEFHVNKETSMKDLYEKYKKKYTSILNYQWGCWVTSYAMYNLHQLGKCIAPDGVWLYSDTDSCYTTKWDMNKVEAYNNKCKQKLKDNGYGAVVIGDKEFWLGCACKDGEYSEFRTVGSKRYAVRDAESGKLKITVAGVPKKGAACLSDDIDNFHKGFIFDGATTGKLQHTYFYESDIWIDANGNERGDSIDLSPTTYVLDDIDVIDWEKLWEEETEMIDYEDLE